MDKETFLKLKNEYEIAKSRIRLVKDNRRCEGLKKTYDDAVDKIDDELQNAFEKLLIAYEKKDVDPKVAEIIKRNEANKKDAEIAMLKAHVHILQTAQKPEITARELELKSELKVLKIEVAKLKTPPILATFLETREPVSVLFPSVSTETISSKLIWSQAKHELFSNFNTFMAAHEKDDKIYIFREHLVNTSLSKEIFVDDVLILNTFTPYTIFRTIETVSKNSKSNKWQATDSWNLEKKKPKNSDVEITLDNILNYSKPFIFPDGFNVKAFIEKYNEVSRKEDKNRTRDWTESWFDVIKQYAIYRKDTAPSKTNLTKETCQQQLQFWCNEMTPTLLNFYNSAVTNLTALQAIKYFVADNKIFKKDDYIYTDDNKILIPRITALPYLDFYLIDKKKTTDVKKIHFGVTDLFFKIYFMRGDVLNPYLLAATAACVDELAFDNVRKLLTSNCQAYLAYTICMYHKKNYPKYDFPTLLLDLNKTEQYLRTMPDLCKYVSDAFLNDLNIDDFVAASFPVYKLDEVVTKTKIKYIGYDRIDAITFKHRHDKDTKEDTGLAVWLFKPLWNDHNNREFNAHVDDEEQTFFYCNQLKIMTGLNVTNFYIRYAVFTDAIIHKGQHALFHVYTYRYDILD